MWLRLDAIREEVIKKDARAAAEGSVNTTLRTVMDALRKYDTGLLEPEQDG